MDHECEGCPEPAVFDKDGVEEVGFKREVGGGTCGGGGELVEERAED